MLSKKSVKPLRYSVHVHVWPTTGVHVCECVCVCVCVFYVWLLFIIKMVADYNIKQPHIVL